MMLPTARFGRRWLVVWMRRDEKDRFFPINLNGHEKCAVGDTKTRKKSRESRGRRCASSSFLTTRQNTSVGVVASSLATPVPYLPLRLTIPLDRTSTMISTAMDGLTRRRGARIQEERERQRGTQQATGKQRLDETILPIPMIAVAMSGAIFVLASLFAVWYHVFYDDEDD